MDDHDTPAYENSNWVPRETYDQLMEKLDAAVMENNRLKAEIKELKEMCGGGAGPGTLPIGCPHY